MRDPLLIDEGEKRIPDEWRRNYLKRDIAKLPGDVAHSFDRIWAIEREKDRLALKLSNTEKRLGWANIKIWILLLVVSGEGAALGWLFKAFLDRLR